MQKDGESMDDYAQDMRKLFHRAYLSAQCGGEAEAMRRSVLSNQFVAKLANRLKAKLVGRSGTFEKLLAQACFEEARSGWGTIDSTNSSQETINSPA
jgi:hypothetical protein